MWWPSLIKDMQIEPKTGFALTWLASRKCLVHTNQRMNHPNALLSIAFYTVILF